MYKAFIKPLFDFLVSLIGLLLSSPIFLLMTLLLVFTNLGKPFFLQPRTGKNEKIFRVIKFKTMNNRKDAKGNLLPDAERLTTIGKLMRKNSLDEIPQLLNVIKGDMSFIGPRPLLIEYLPLYNETQKRRHKVRPGMTGWAQVNGRNAISWTEKFKLDVWYVDNLSLSLDMKIFFMTIRNVIKREGISQNGHVTTDIFNGKN